MAVAEMSKYLSSQAEEVILSVINYFKRGKILP